MDDNAAQALLIAGGILFAIMTISLLVVMFGNLNTIGTAQEDKEDVERLDEWNQEWEAYNKKLLYGTEVLTVINKAEQNNSDYNNQTKYTVEIKVFDGVNIEAEVKSDGTIVNRTYLEVNKTTIFKCTKMERSGETGRVKKIEFEVVK